jgi:GTP-binding protein LepA
VKVGDTITHHARACSKVIADFRMSNPGIRRVYPVDADDYEELRSSMENCNSMTLR